MFFLEDDGQEVNSKTRNRIKTDFTKKIFTGEGYLLKKPPKAYKKFWEKRFFRLRNGVLYWYKNENAIEAQNKMILTEATECFPYKESNKFKILINSTYYKFSASSPKECEQWVQAITKAINREEEKNQEEEEEKNKAIYVIEQKNKFPLFVDYDMELRIENNKNLIRKRTEKEKTKVEIMNKIVPDENVSQLPPMVIVTGLSNLIEEANNIPVQQENIEEIKEGKPKKKSFWGSLLN